MSERWSNPLTVAVIAAALAGFSSIYLAHVNNRAQVALEASKAESDRILEVLKIGEPERVRENLRFLLQLGLVQDDELRRKIEAWQADPNRARVYLSPAAIADFQRGSGMPADGRAGPLTRQRMRDAGAEPPPPTEKGGY